ncbi:hypothetical protein ACOMHN_009396 [Nucella lapillus]
MTAEARQSWLGRGAVWTLVLLCLPVCQSAPYRQSRYSSSRRSRAYRDPCDRLMVHYVQQYDCGEPSIVNHRLCSVLHNILTRLGCDMREYMVFCCSPADHREAT